MNTESPITAAEKKNVRTERGTRGVIRYSKERKIMGIGGRLLPLFAILILLAAGIGIHVKAQNGPVRVGFYQLRNFVDYGEDGEPVGYCIEYLDKIADITGWQYEYVEVETWVEGMELLEKKEIDLLAPAQITEERMQAFDFCSYSFGTEYVALMTTKDNESYEYEDFASFDGMRVGALKDYLITERFQDHAKEKNLRMSMTLYETPAQMLDALDNNKVEAAVVNLMMVSEDYKVIDKFAPGAFYFMTWKGNLELLGKLDAAMAQIKTDSPSLEQEMTVKYYPNYQWQYYTREEQEYIASLGSVDVWYAPNRSPLSFADQKTGEMQGISRQIFDRIQEISGLQFVYRELPVGSLDTAAIEEKGFCLITGVENNDINKELATMYVSDYYFSSKKVLVTGMNLVFDRQNNYRVGTCTGSKTLELFIREEYPGFEVKIYPSNKECFATAEKGEVDLIMINQYVADYWLSMPRFEKYQVIPVEGLKDELCFGAYVPKGEKDTEKSVNQKMLITILNKAISRLSQEEIDGIVIKETMSGKYRYNFLDFIYKYSEILITLLIAVSVTFVILVYALVQKKKSGERLAAQLETQERLALEQKRYSLLIEKSEAPVFEMSLQPEVSLSEGKMKEKLGWSLLEEKDLKAPDILSRWKIHPEDTAEMEYAICRSYRHKQISECTVRLVTHGGVYRWFQVSRYPVLDKEGNLISVIGQVMDVDEKMREKTYLREQSQRDGLTGLWNKKTFLEKAAERLAGEEGPVGFVFMDLDYFKQINDTLGHLTGDRALQDVAAGLKEFFGKDGLLCRFGGDEFCILVCGWSVDMLQETLQNFVKNVCGEYREDGKCIRLTVSAGAYWRKEAKIPLVDMIKEADEVLYEVKRSGRDGIKIKVF